jgi:hypothetical protein
MKNIAYIAGNEYCVLSITKKQAQSYGIDNPDNVIIQATQQGILIKNKDAGARNTSLEHRTADFTTTTKTEVEFHGEES